MSSELKPHEFSALVPDMTPEQYEQLVEDIGSHGLHEPIVLYESKILDGRHRYRACLELEERGVKTGIRFDDFEGTRKDAYAYVLSMNLHRRHLEFSQRAALAAMWKRAIQKSGEYRRGRPKKDAEMGVFSGEARDVAAEKYQVGKNTVDQAEYILEVAPDLFDQMMQGNGTLREHQRTIKERQRQERNERMASSDLPTGKYRVIYADPPWEYGNTMPEYYNEQGDHYPLMSIAEICQMPVKELAEDDAVLFLWVTSPILEESFQVIKAWGFKYKSSFVWDKVKHNMGHYNSLRHEFLLVCTRGSCQPDVQRLFDSVIEEERTDHSCKPETFRQIIDTLYTWGAKLELFARVKADGWEAYGNELSCSS